jgi:hypothetical protein
MSHSIFEWREIPESIMGAFFIVLVDPFFGDGPHLR